MNTEILGRTRFKNMLTDQGTEFLDAYLVMVGARLPCDQLHDDLRANQEIGMLEFAGDCVVPGTIQSAVLSEHGVARKLLENQYQTCRVQAGTADLRTLKQRHWRKRNQDQCLA